MSDASTRLKLSYVSSGQAQKHVTHNESLTILDALVHLSVEARNLDEPVLTPEQAQCWIVGPSPAGEWQTHSNDIAEWRDGSWSFFNPTAGFIAYVKAEDIFLYFSGTEWFELSSTMQFPSGWNVEEKKLGLNAMATDQERLSVKSESVVLAHDDGPTASGDVRLKVNKSAADKTASVVFQNAWSGRAELGLAGDDSFRIKTSSNGSDWSTAFKIDSTTGNVGINAEPTRRLRVAGGDVQIGWNLISASEFSGGAAMEIMGAGNGDRLAFFDFHACDELQDYSARFIRWSGLNGAFAIYNQGVGGIELVSQEAAPIKFKTSNVDRMTVASNGNVGVGLAAPTALLHVASAMRLSPLTLAELPAASQIGAGGIAYVSDKPGGAGLMICNGASWV